MSSFERTIAIVGIVVGVITAAIFYVQLNVMTRQTQILASQSEGTNAGALMDEMNTRKQISIAQQQADAAQRTASAINKQMVAGERPWLGVVDMHHDKPDVFSPPSKFWLIVSNTGKSPGIETTFKLECGVFAKFPSDPPYRHAPKDEDKIVVIPEARVITAPIYKHLTTQDEGDIVSQAKTFYVYAKLVYKDPLTKKPHFTKYCAMWMPLVIEGFGDPENPTGSFGICPFYNDAD